MLLGFCLALLVFGLFFEESLLDFFTFLFFTSLLCFVLGPDFLEVSVSVIFLVGCLLGPFPVLLLVVL